jgi:hypothetical protein
MSTFNLLPEKEKTPSSRHYRRLRGQKAPFKPREVWAIRALLQTQGRMRELALFNLAIDSKLRGCDLVIIMSGVPHNRHAHLFNIPGHRPIKIKIRRLLNDRNCR